MAEFDRVVALKFRTDLQPYASARLRLEGQCATYNYVDDVWKFDMSQCEIKGESFHESSKNCQLIAIDANQRDGEKAAGQIRKMQVVNKGPNRFGRGGIMRR